jgi:hypothetical protein
MNERRLSEILDWLFGSGGGRFAPEQITVVSTTPILWSGWECDHTAWVLELPDGSRRIVIEAASQETDAAEVLRERLAAYREAISATEALLALGRAR